MYLNIVTPLYTSALFMVNREDARLVVKSPNVMVCAVRSDPGRIGAQWGDHESSISHN